jgi:hypothetical protein
MGFQRLACKTLGFGGGHFAAPLFLFATLSACHGGGDDDSAPSCPAPANARGSDACHAWQSAICNWAGKCNTLDKCTCVDQASAITCVSDDEATRCAQVLASASCSATSDLTGCDLTEMADPAPAMAACQAYITAVCTTAERCGGGPASDCVTSTMGTGSNQLDCTRAVGAKPSLDQCLSELQNLSCSASALPASCKNALLLTP